MLAPEASAFRSLFAKALGESRTGRSLAHVCVFSPRFRPETRAVRPRVPLVPPTPGCWHRGHLAPGAEVLGAGCGLSPGSALQPQPSWLCHGIAEAAPRSLVLPLPRDTRRFLTQRRRFVVHTPNKTCSPCLSPLPPFPLFFFFFLLFLIVLSSGRARHQGQEGMSPVPWSLPAPWGSAGWQQPQDL